MKQRLIVAITGASGTALAVNLMQHLRQCAELELHLIMTDSALRTCREEYPQGEHLLRNLADRVYDPGDIGAAVASGSFRTRGMVVIPCSMKTLAGIHSGYSDNLVLRAADVMLKEGKPLLLVPRELPLSPVHLRNMYELSMMGVRMLPPMMTFYQKPETITDMMDHLSGKIMDQLGLECPAYRRWMETE